MTEDFLNPEELKEAMVTPPKTKLDLLKYILSKGIDVEYLDELKNYPVDENILKDCYKLEDKDRIARLEILVERLLTRMERLEKENEMRMLENIMVVVRLTEFMKQITPMTTQLFSHFFAE